MEIGVSFPRDALGLDLTAIRDFVQAADDLGYEHITVDDHVVGPLKTHPVGSGAPQHLPHIDPMVFYGFLAGCTTRIQFISIVLILPQRQTVIVAKQLAAADFLSNGRVRLGAAVGWNPEEYEILHEDFHNRGARIAEQVAVMRELWSHEVVNFEGKWHKIDGVGLKPMPVQRPIPVFLGGYDDRAMQRAARIADGWFVQSPPGSAAGATPESGATTIVKIRGFVKEAGRDPASFKVHAHTFNPPPNATPADWQKLTDDWRALDCAYMTFNARHPTGGLQGQIENMRLFKKECH